MPTVADIMTPHVHVVGPQDTLRQAAQLMGHLNVGALPVCAGRDVLGMVTDRDITVRGTAAGLVPDDACVSDVMTQGTEFCTVDQDVRDAMNLMSRAPVRRLPVLDGDRHLVGIVALADMATRQAGHIDETVREISTPSTAEGASQPT